MLEFLYTLLVLNIPDTSFKFFCLDKVVIVPGVDLVITAREEPVHAQSGLKRPVIKIKFSSKQIAYNAYHTNFHTLSWLSEFELMVHDIEEKEVAINSVSVSPNFYFNCNFGCNFL